VRSAKWWIPEMVLTYASERIKYVSHRSGLRTQFNLTDTTEMSKYEGHLESKERFAIKKYLLIIGKKKNM
jgi:hypothetical protein